MMLRHLDEKLDELSWKLRKLHRQERCTMYRLAVLSYQLGHTQRALVYKAYYEKRRGAKKQEVKGYELEAVNGLADLVIQAAVLARQLGYSFSDLVKLGIRRLEEYLESGR